MFCSIAQVNTCQCFGTTLHKRWKIHKLANLVVDGCDNSHFIKLLKLSE